MDWGELLQTLLYTVITTAVPVITYYLASYLTNISKKVSVEIENTIFEDTINDAMNIVLAVVSSTSQTFVDSLKNSGNFSKEAQLEAFNKSKENIMELLSDEAKEIIQTVYHDLDKWIDTQIEASVRAIKLTSNKEGE